MDVLEVLHVLADHEQVILPLVHDLEFLDGLAVARMKDSEEELCLLAGFCNRRYGAEFKLVVADIEWRGTDEIHSTTWAFAGGIHRVVGMHRADPGRFFVDGLLTQEGWNHKGTKTQN